MYSTRIYSLLLTISLAVIAIVGCTSRYRMSLFQTVDEVRRKVKVEETQYVRNAVLAPDAEEKFKPGNGNIIILTTGTRGTKQSSGLYNFLSYDEYLRCEVFFQLPPTVAADTISVINNSFLALLKHYELSPDARLFLPDSGRLVIDSIAGNRLFGTVAALYKNGQGIPMAIDGKFKVKIAK